VLGPNAGKVMEDAVARGLLTVTDRKVLSLHPLLRELLIQRFGESDAEVREALLSQCRKLFETQRWDEALSVAEISLDPVFAAEALGTALDELLATGRTSSLRRWVATTRSAGAEGGLIDYAESEALFRGGELNRAMALATQAAGSLDGDLVARAHLVAGRSAHLMDSPDRTGQHAELAAAAAETAESREGALWLRHLRAHDQEALDLTARLADFKSYAQSGLKQSLMLAAAELGAALIEGGLLDALESAQSALTLATKDADPIAYTGFLRVYGYALAVNGRYDEALKCVGTMTRLAEGSGIEFPLLYGQVDRARALIGLRRFTSASRTLSVLERQMQHGPNSFLDGNVPVQRARLAASVGDLNQAVDALSLGPPTGALRTGSSAFLGWQALFSAAAGDSDRAKAHAAQARRAGRGVEAHTLALLAEAIIALADGRESESAAYLGSVIETGVCDPLVIAVRAAPDLGAFVAAQPRWRSRLQRLLAGSRDASLAGSLGIRIPRAAKAKTSLSPRETEVHELVADGLTNEEIARLLYISVSTTKVHVKHIYEKLGVRSRLEAARALRDDV